MLACKVTSSMPQPALCASIWRAGLALLRSAFFAHTIGLLFPLRFGECVFALHLPTLVTWPFIQVFLAQRVPVHRLLLPHVKKKLPSERENSLKWAKWEWTVDQNLLSCTASRHADVRGKWIHATEIGDDARLCFGQISMGFPGVCFTVCQLDFFAILIKGKSSSTHRTKWLLFQSELLNNQRVIQNSKIDSVNGKSTFNYE